MNDAYATNERYNKKQGSRVGVIELAKLDEYTNIANIQSINIRMP